MGAFYVNYTVKDADRNSIVRALSGRKAFVTPELDGYIIIFDEESDKQDQRAIGRLAARLSASLKCTILSALNHDSDVLWYQLYEAGTLTDQYNSAPDYWSPKPQPSTPEGGDTKRLCASFGCTNVAEVERILRMPLEKYPDVTKRHADLLHALNLPDIVVGYGFGAIAQGYFPDGLSAKDLLPTN